MPIYQLGDDAPVVPPSAYVAPNATLIGKVRLGERTTVWFNVVIRADSDLIEIGAGSNVQDAVVLHADPGFPLKIASNVSIGHQAMLHGCTVGEGSLIGIQSVVLNGAVIGRSCLVGAGAIVTEGKTFPDRSLILGAPARVVRELTDQEIANLADISANYALRGETYRSALERID